MKRILSLGLFACALLLTAGCRTPQADPNDRLDGPSEGQYGPIVLQIRAPEGMSRLQIQHAIQNAVFTTDWTIRKNEQGRLTGLMELYRKNYSYEAILTLRYDGNAIEGYIESYARNYDGTRSHRKVPESWIDRLSKKITRNIELEAVGY